VHVGAVVFNKFNTFKEMRFSFYRKTQKLAMEFIASSIELRSPKSRNPLRILS